MTDDDIDGAPLEDIDGVPIAAHRTNATPASAPLGITMRMPGVPGVGGTAATAAAPAPLSFTLGSSVAAVGQTVAGGMLGVVAPQLTQHKLALFDAGVAPTTLAQTPYARRQAEAEEKRRKAEEEAAREYEKFVHSFDTTPRGGGGNAAPAYTGASAARRGGGAPAGRSSALLTHKAFVSGGVMGGDVPAQMTSSSSSSAAAASTAAASSGTAIAAAAPASFSSSSFTSSFVRGGPAAAPGARPLDPTTLRAGLPSMAGPPKATPFAFVSASSSPAFAASTAAPHGGAVTAFSLDIDPAADDSAAAAALSAATKSAAAAKKGKKRNIDMFLEELKQNEQDKALGLAPRERERGGGPGGPVDLGEPGSTNMYVNNLPLDITERRLAELFAEHGDVASVKIMWPRADERTPTTTTRLHCGFVSFMRREDAETAMQEMQNKFVGEGAQLKLNWSRALPLPTHPYMHKIRHAGSSNGNGGGFGSGPSSSSSKTAASEPAPLPAPVADSFPFPPDAIKYQVELPAERELRALIDLVASHVVAQGLPLEQALCARAVAAAAAAPGTTPDASLAFLAHPASLEALYYRWRVYLLAQGDSLRHWRSTPFQMVAGGPFFVPPDWARLTRAEERRKDERRRAREAKRDAEREAERQERRRADRERERERERDRSAAAGLAAASSLSKNVGNWDRNVTGGVVEKGVERGRLSASAAAMLTSLLRSVSLDRTSVRDCMGWCMDHADASVDVVACVADSLTLDETPLAKKVARLYVVSDLLYNSSAPVANASSFRTRLQEALPAILHSFHRAHARALSEGGRITADALRTKVTATLRAWNQWGVFPNTFLAKLEDIFNKGDPTNAAASASASTPATSAATNAAP